MSSGASLQTDQRRLQVGGVGQQLLPGELLLNQHLAGCTQRHKVKGRLAQVDANGMYLHVDDPPVTACSSHPRLEMKKQAADHLINAVVEVDRV